MNTAPDNPAPRAGQQASRKSIDALLLRKSPEPSRMPRMHWRWRRRGRDLETVIFGRCGTCLPDDDAGREYLRQLVNHWVRLVPNGVSSARANARLQAMWLTVPELDAIIASAVESLESPPIPATKLGKAFRVTADEVTQYGLTSITAFDHCAAANRQRKRTWAAKARRAKGTQPREQYLATSKSRTKPWEAEGISRSTWERRRKAKTEIDASVSTHHPSIERCDVDGLASRSIDSVFDPFLIPAPPGRHAVAGLP
jgi:hypothetical protein